VFFPECETKFHSIMLLVKGKIVPVLN
jgi:hypothetical protein